MNVEDAPRVEARIRCDAY